MVDVHTQSNCNDVVVKHLSLNLTLDMNAKKFHGFVDVHFDNRGGEKKLVLDTKNLEIQKAEILDPIKNTVTEAAFSLGAHDPVRGRALSIALEASTTIARIHYATTKDSTGLDWIDATLTADGFAMVVTQFQAINARTFVPCQDTPARKITYDATMKLKSDVNDPRMRIVMAAMERAQIAHRTYQFKMTNPISPYLIALAAGVFEEIPISNRVSVIAEPSMAKKAANEFADAENMVRAAEELLGSYDWKRFDIFIMPPSFSYGGMENPTMTFIGPTVVAGDKSLVDVIAHELAHSWSGNWVTNKNWDEFWINEGTTMYIERLIVAKLYGEKLRDLDIVLGQQILKDDVEHITNNPRQGAPFTRLKLTMTKDFDPDDAVTHVPYEKGFNFWLALEQAYGQPAVVAFLKQYFADHAYGVMDSVTLKRIIETFPAFDGAKKIDIDLWFHGEGLPALPKVKSALVDHVDRAVRALHDPSAGVAGMGDASAFETKQWSYFLRSAKKTSPQGVKALNDRYHLSDKNDEVRSNFYVFAIRSNAFENYKEAIDAYLSRVGRIKYVAPIYEALKEAGLSNRATALFEKHQNRNNHITNGAISRRLA